MSEMKQKYTITITDNETGAQFMHQVECNGFMIVGCVGPVNRYEAVRIRLHNVNRNDMVNALYTEPELRKAAWKMTADAPPRRMTIWKRLFGRKRQ